MKEHQLRVVYERDALNEKYTKLQKFMTTQSYRDLTTVEQYLLSDQTTYMYQYLRVLDARISMFKQEPV